MRKGLTLTLSTIVLALAVSAAFAKGPTIGGVPDVWITQKTTDTNTFDGVSTSNLFRFPNALNLNGYIIPGATDGSQTSATLFWVYAVKNAGIDGTPIGSFLDPATLTPTTNTIHYQINSKNAVKPTNTVGTSAWTTEINTAAQNSSQSDQVKNDLSFRNIRVNPGALTHYDPPVKCPLNLPAGYVDVQEATLYVTDKTTTPGLDQILLVTLIDRHDTLSGGGPRWSVEKDYTGILTDTSNPWTGFKLVTDWNGAGNGDTGSNALCTFSIGANSMSITSPVSQTLTSGGRGVVQYGQLAPNNNVNVVTSKVYRMRATVSSNNATAIDPTVFVRLNGRATVGMGEFLLTEGTASGPTTTPKTIAAYLWPAAAGSAQAQFGVQDSTATYGGTFTATNVIVDSFDPTKLIGKSDLKDVGNGATTGFTFATVATPGSFNLSGPYNFTGMSMVSFTTTGSGSTAIVLNGSGSASSTQGFAYYGTTLFTTSASAKLVSVKVNVSSSTTGTPDIRFRLASGADASQPTFWINRNADGGPSSTAKDYYVMFESSGAATSFDFFIDAILDGATSCNGELKINRVTISEYSKPN
jgi:hypothetical protein